MGLIEKCKKKTQIVSYKSFVTCRCFFFQLVIFLLGIVLKGIFFVGIESGTKDYEAYIMENKSIIFSASLETSLNMLDSMTNKTISMLHTVDAQYQIYSSNSA